MILSNCTIFDGFKFLDGKYNIFIENRKIIDIKKYSKISDSIDVKGCFVVPGYIDLHTHGICGMDFSYSTDFEINNFFDSYICMTRLASC